jgi:hypothetical protein
MKIVFNVREWAMEAHISPASLRDLEELTPIAQADLWQDVLHDATIHYKEALARMEARFEAGRAKFNSGQNKPS